MSRFEVKNGFVYDGNLRVDINDVVKLLNYATDKITKLEQSQQTKSVADEGEKWAHGIPPNSIYCRVNHGGEFVNCYLVGRDDMGAFVYRIDGGYYSTMCESNLKPIKPKLTKSKILSMIECKALGDDDDDEFRAKVISWFEQYDII